MAKLTYLEDFLNSPGINYEDMVNFVSDEKKFSLDIKDFTLIEQGFRIKWNNSTGQIVGDGDFKNAVYRYLEWLMTTKILRYVIPQTDVDGTVDLILDYMSSTGEWYSDFSKN